MAFRPTDLEDAQGRTQVTLKEEGGRGSLGARRLAAPARLPELPGQPVGDCLSWLFLEAHGENADLEANVL